MTSSNEVNAEDKDGLTCSGSNAASSVDSSASCAADTTESSLGQALAKAYSTACRGDSPSDSSLTSRLALSLRPFPTRCLIDCKRKAVDLVTYHVKHAMVFILAADKGVTALH